MYGIFDEYVLWLVNVFWFGLFILVVLKKFDLLICDLVMLGLLIVVLWVFVGLVMWFFVE